MERLTEKHYTGDGYYLKCSGVAGCPDSCDDCDKLDEVIERLGSYEDAEEQGRLWITPCGPLQGLQAPCRRNRAGQLSVQPQNDWSGQT